MTIHAQEFGEAAVLECRGKLTAGGATYVFGEAVHELMRKHGRVILDFSGVEQIDCAALGALASCLREAEERGCRVGCFAASRRIRNVLEMMHLDEFLEFYDGDQKALARLVAHAA